jgi:deoxyribonuclease-4
MGAIESALEAGAEAAQIWGSNPRQWALPAVADDQARAFGRAWRAAGLGELVIHSPYTVNIASATPDFRRRSVELARATVALAEQIGATGVVVHAGSAGVATPRPAALALAADSLTAICSVAERSRLFVELMAGTAGSVASTFVQARELFAEARMHPRLALCADTCHLFATGYALDTEEGVEACFAELREAGLTRRLRLIHANDSKFPRGLHRDSHIGIGLGHIGEEGFRAVLAHPAVERCAVICETPGTLRDTARNVATLKRLAARPGPPT